MDNAETLTARSRLVGMLRARVAQQKSSLSPEQLAFEENVAKVRRFLAKRGIAVLEHRFDDHLEFTGSICCENAVYDRFGFHLSLTDRCLYFRMTLPGHVPSKVRRPVIDFLSRVTWDIVWGGLKLDLTDGEVAYEHAIPYAALSGGNAEDELDRLIGIPSALFPLLAIPLASVMLAAKTPKAAWLDFQAAERDAGLDGEIENPSPIPEDDDGLHDDDDCDGSVAHTAVSTNRHNPMSTAPIVASAELPAGYSLDVLNIHSKIPLAQIIKGARRFQSGKHIEGIDRPRFGVLLEGPPGAGKSAFVRHFTHEIGAALMEVRGSDLISPYVGKTEQNLAAAFKEAAQKHAVLFLDEIDSLLWSRSSAMHAWEASQVNELLGQIEKASCIVIGATNYCDRLDAAVARRFTFKVKLDFLAEGGKVAMFAKVFGRKLGNAQRARLAAIPNLCPGDFRTVKEELFYAKDYPTADDYLDALEKESEAKGVNEHKRIGFNAS